MKKLSELVTVEVNNEECVVLKVKEDAKFDLIALGCFNGDEKMLRLTKGKNHTATVFADERQYSWNWGYNGYTLVSDSVSKCGRLIQECIEEDFGIYIRAKKDKIRNTLHIKTLADKVGKPHQMRIMYWHEGDTSFVIHKDEEHLTTKGSVCDARSYVKNHYDINSMKVYNAPQTGCIVEEFQVTSK